MEEWERLLRELRKELTLREQELELLHEIDLKLLEPELPPEAIFDFIVEETKSLLRASHTTILLRRSNFLEPMYSNLKSVVGQRVLIAKSLTGLSLESKELVNVADLTTSKYKEKYEQLRGYEGPQMRSLLAAPIKIRDTVVGVLNAESTKVNAFRAVHERMADAIAAQVAIALQRTQTLVSTNLFADVDSLMLHNGDEQYLAQHSEDVIQQALQKVMVALKELEHVHHTGAQVMFLRGKDELEIVNSTNATDIGLIVQVSNSVSGRAIREGHTVIEGDVREVKDYQQMLGSSIRSEIAVPILFGTEPIGVLNVESDELNAFYGFYQVVLENFAEKVRNLLAFARLRDDLTDALESRSASDLLLAVGDRAGHIVHRLNNTVGAMRFLIMELQGKQAVGKLEDDFLRDSLGTLRDLAERTLRMPSELTPLGQTPTTFDVNQCVQKALDQIAWPANIALEKHLAEDIPPLSLYSFDIVVQNLLQNALDAMKNQASGRLIVRTAIVLDPTYSKGYLQLRISDTGPGIPDEVQKHMFELNFTTKKAKGKGLGFGLWWVRTFVRRSRGDITIDSKPGSGTVVIVKIPVSRSTAILQVVAAD